MITRAASGSGFSEGATLSHPPLLVRIIRAAHEWSLRRDAQAEYCSYLDSENQDFLQRYILRTLDRGLLPRYFVPALWLVYRFFRVLEDTVQVSH